MIKTFTTFGVLTASGTSQTSMIAARSSVSKRAHSRSRNSPIAEPNPSKQKSSAN